MWNNVVSVVVTNTVKCLMFWSDTETHHRPQIAVEDFFCAKTCHYLLRPLLCPETSQSASASHWQGAKQIKREVTLHPLYMNYILSINDNSLVASIKYRRLWADECCGNTYILFAFSGVSNSLYRLSTCCSLDSSRTLNINKTREVSCHVFRIIRLSTDGVHWTNSGR